MKNYGPYHFLCYNNFILNVQLINLVVNENKTKKALLGSHKIKVTRQADGEKLIHYFKKIKLSCRPDFSLSRRNE